MIQFVYESNFYSKELFEDIKYPLNLNALEEGLDIGHSIQYSQTFTPPGIENVFRDLLGSRYRIDENQSGLLRRPNNSFIHFEEFMGDQWCCAVALEDVTFNIYKHNSGAKDAREEVNFNYKYSLDWDYKLNILLNKRDCIFFRPWLFHSFDGGLIHYFNIIK